MEGPTWVTAFSFLNGGHRDGSYDGHCWFALLVPLMEGSTGVTAFSGLNDGRNNVREGLRLARNDSFRERFIPLGNEPSGPAGDVSQSGTAAVILHIDDGCPGNRLHGSAHLSAGDGFRAGVHISNRSAEDASCVENQGSEEESRG